MDVASAAAIVACRGQGADDDAAGDQLGRKRGAGNVPAGGRNGEVLWIYEPGAGSTQRGDRGDLDAVGDLDVCGGGFDEAAVTAVGRTGIEGASDVHRAALHVAQEHDRAVAIFQRA